MAGQGSEPDTGRIRVVATLKKFAQNRRFTKRPFILFLLYLFDSSWWLICFSFDFFIEFVRLRKFIIIDRLRCSLWSAYQELLRRPKNGLLLG